MPKIDNIFQNFPKKQNQKNSNFISKVTNINKASLLLFQTNLELNKYNSTHKKQPRTDLYCTKFQKPMKEREERGKQTADLDRCLKDKEIRLG